MVIAKGFALYSDFLFKLKENSNKYSIHPMTHGPNLIITQ